MHELVMLYICFVSMAFTALWKALCLLWCRKLEIPSYAKPMKSEVSKVIIPCFSFLSIYFGKIKSISFFQNVMHCMVKRISLVFVIFTYGLFFLQYVIQSNMCSFASVAHLFSFCKILTLFIIFNFWEFKSSMVGKKILWPHKIYQRSVLTFLHIYNLYHSQIL